jgi:hypothetical protein
MQAGISVQLAMVEKPKERFAARRNCIVPNVRGKSIIG